MSAGKDTKSQQEKIKEFESQALPSNENEYRDITDTLTSPSKIQLPKTEEPVCDYCNEKAVKTVHSFADKDGTPTNNYYCEKHDRA